MEVRFYRDPETGLPQIFNHGVTEPEVEWILIHASEDGPSSRESRQAIGHTEHGKCLRVVYVPDAEGDGVFVVTAYPVQATNSKRFDDANGGDENERPTIS